MNYKINHMAPNLGQNNYQDNSIDKNKLMSYFAIFAIISITERFFKSFIIPVLINSQILRINTHNHKYSKLNQNRH
jgi:hypothetical protein